MSNSNHWLRFRGLDVNKINSIELAEEHRWKVLDECQVELSRNQKELKSYALLFKGLKDAQVSGKSLYGTARALKRMRQRLDEINQKLSDIY